MAGTTEIHFRILSNRRYCKSNPSRTASKQPFLENILLKNFHQKTKIFLENILSKNFHENTKNLLDKIPLKNLHEKIPKIHVTQAVTNLQNFTLGLSPKKRDPQKSKGVHKKEGSQRSPNRAPRLSNQKSNLPP